MTDIIQVIETLCDKVGIAIDWTSENVVPQIQEVIHRYSMAKIVEYLIGIVVPLIFIVVAIVAIKFIYKAYQKSIWSDDSLFEDVVHFIPIVLLLGAIAIAVVVIVCNGIELSQWALVPEIKIIEMLK